MLIEIVIEYFFDELIVAIIVINGHIFMIFVGKDMVCVLVNLSEANDGLNYFDLEL